MKPPEPTLATLNQGRSDGAMGSTARALPAGTRVNEFEIEEVIDEGDATIIYAAADGSLAAPMAIAEYMPALIAQRDDEAQVLPRTSVHADLFARGLKAFIAETRKLGECDHPSLVRIVNLFEANGTAYRVMPRYLGERLLEVRRRMAEPPDEDAVRALLDALLGALEAFHRTAGFHGKVTPSNILLLADHRPLLLSPGAADRAIAGDQIDALMTSLEPSFAPVEQILESADAPLHPSVDLYALAGVARYWISGELPGPAFGARDTAPREPLADTVQRLRLNWPRLHYGASLLDTLESALSIYPAERPQSVAQMRARLGTAPPVAAGFVSPPSSAASGLNDAAPLSPERALRAAHDLDDVIVSAPDPAPLAGDSVPGIDHDPSARTVFARQVPKSRRMAMWSAVVVLLLALMPIGLYEFHQESLVVPAPAKSGVNRGIGAEDSATASAVGPTTPVIPPIAADAGTGKSTSTVDTVADSSASAAESTSLANANPADAGTSAEPAAVTQRPAPSPTPSRVAQQHASRAPTSPRAACGSRTRFSLYRCMQKQCSQRQWTSHPQCEHLRATDSVD